MRDPGAGAAAYGLLQNLFVLTKPIPRLEHQRQRGQFIAEVVRHVPGEVPRPGVAYELRCRFRERGAVGKSREDHAARRRALAS